MNYRFITFFLFSIVLLITKHAVAAPPLLLTDTLVEQKHALLINPHLDIMEDVSGKLRLEDVLSPAYNNNFTGNLQGELDFLFTRSAYWVRAEIINQSHIRDWYLDYGGGLSRQGALYLRVNNDLHPFIQQYPSSGFRSNVYHFVLAQNTSYVFYMRVQDTQAPLVVGLGMYSSVQMLQRATREYPLFGFLIGGLLVLVLYNFIYFIYLRERSFLSLSAFILMFTLALSNHAGVLHYFDFFLKYLPLIGSTFSFFAVASAIIFIVSLLHIKANLPRLYPYYRVLFWLSLLLVIIAFFLPYSLAIVGILSCCLLLLITLTLVLFYWHNIQIPSSVSVALAIMLFGLIPTLLRMMGLVENIPIIVNSLYLILLVSLTLLSLSQAERTRLECEQVGQIAASNKAKDEFLTIMSHELRTPMNAVVSAGKLLSTTPLSAVQQGSVDRLEISSQHMLELINDILDLARIDSTQLSLETIPFYLDELLQQIEQLLNDQAKGKGLSLVVNNQFSFQNNQLIGDPTRLKQILINLISNAIKFTSKGSITVNISIEQHHKDKVALLFSVKDTGIGLSAKQQQLLFQPFSQADNNIARKYGGSGLGLAISYKLVKRMGGKLQLRSTHGKGSCFYFTLNFPLQDSLAKTDTDLVVEKSQTSKSIVGAQILLVDDDDLNLYFGQALLQTLDVHVATAKSGMEAIKQLQQQDFDLVLMDISMPEMDGYETTRRIRTEKQFSHLPIIALTAHAIVGEKERCLVAGMNEYVSKPFELEHLKKIFQQWIIKE